MNKKYSKIAVLAVAAVALSSGMCLAASAYVDQYENQDYNGFSVGTPHSGLTRHYGGQVQDNFGYALGWNSSVSANQFEEQAHHYSSARGGVNNWTGQGGASYMSADMEGSARRGFGFFGADGSQDYSAVISTFNRGPGYAYSYMGDSFDQSIDGSAWGCYARVGNSLVLSAENSYAQLTTRGNDWVFHSGESSTNSRLSGNAGHYGSYDGFVVGSQAGRTVTAQSSDGTYQVGSQVASANLIAGGHSSYRAGVSFNADIDQTHSYQQGNAGPNGWQYGEGTVTTHVSVSGRR